jgi:hypothetical protein
MKQFGFPQIARGGDGGGGGGGGESGDAMDAYGMGHTDFSSANVGLGGLANTDFSAMEPDMGFDEQGFSGIDDWGGPVDAVDFAGRGGFGSQGFGQGYDEVGFDTAFGQPGQGPGGWDDVGFDMAFGMPGSAPSSSFDEAGFGGLGGIGGFADAWGGLGIGHNTNPGPSNPNLAQGFPAFRGDWGLQFGLPEWIDLPQGTPNAPSSNVAFGLPGSQGEPAGSSPGGFGAPSNASPTSAPSAPSAPPGVTVGSFGLPAGTPVGYATPNMSFGGTPGGRMAWEPDAGTNVAAPTSVGDFGYILPNGNWTMHQPTGGAYAFMGPDAQWMRYNTPNSPHGAAITQISERDPVGNAPSNYLIGQGYRYYDEGSGLPAPQSNDRVSASGNPLTGQGPNYVGAYQGGYFYR